MLHANSFGSSVLEVQTVVDTRAYHVVLMCICPAESFLAELLLGNTGRHVVFEVLCLSTDAGLVV